MIDDALPKPVFSICLVDSNLSVAQAEQAGSQEPFRLKTYVQIRGIDQSAPQPRLRPGPRLRAAKVGKSFRIRR